MSSVAPGTARDIAAALSGAGARNEAREVPARIAGLVLMFVIVVGAALRIWQYAANTA